jgi:Kef-type K+ transport system membrane component KefB
VLKTAIIMLAARPFAGQWFKALRTGIVISQGGEFGFALLAILLHNRLVAAEFTQPLLAAITLSMLISPFSSGITSESRASCCARPGRARPASSGWRRRTRRSRGAST